MSIVLVTRRGPIIAVAADSCISGDEQYKGMAACKIMPCGKRAVAFACGDAKYSFEYLREIMDTDRSLNSEIKPDVLIESFERIVRTIQSKMTGQNRRARLGLFFADDERNAVIIHTIQNAMSPTDKYEVIIGDPYDLVIPPADDVTGMCIDMLKSELSARPSPDAVLTVLQHLIQAVSTVSATVDHRVQYWMIDLESKTIYESLVPLEPILPYFAL